MHLHTFNNNGSISIFTVVADGYMYSSDFAEIFLDNRVVGN